MRIKMYHLNKKRVWPRLAAILLCLSFVLSLFACSKDESRTDVSDVVSDTDTEPVASEEINTEGKLVLALNGECKVTIVTAEFATDHEQQAATKVYNKFKSLIGSAPNLKDDFASSGQEQDGNSLEILVGDTRYAQSQNTIASLRYGDYAVKAVGNKIVLCGASPEGTVKACSDFVSLMTRHTKNKSLLIDAALDEVGVVLPFANDLPAYDTVSVSRPLVNDTGDGCMALTVNGTSVSELSAYRQKLESNGYSLYDSRQLGKDESSLYAQYIGEKYTVTVLYTNHDTTSRVFIEPLSNTGLPTKTADDYTATGDDPFIMQIGVTDSGDPIANGASYMARLADGSFIVYDGGMDDTLTQSKQYNRQNARRILEMIKQYGAKNPDGKFVIAAWVITHGHIDHIGAFEAFVEAGYESEVNIERVICNLPSDEQIAKSDEDNELGNKMSSYRALLRQAKTEGALIHKAHPGQVFKLRDATLEILYTYDFYCEKEITLFNDTSIVTRLTLGGQKVMVTGDIQGDAAKAMIEVYGNTMSADFITVPHHGWFYGGTREFYELVSPEYVLWPIGEDRQAEVMAWNVHKYFFDNSLKIWYANNKTTVIYLPYDGNTDVSFDNQVYA